MDSVPTHASKLMRPRVWMLDKPKPITAAMATNAAVHREWSERAFREVEIPTIPEPATNVYTL